MLIPQLPSNLIIPFDIRCLSSNISSHIHCLGSNKVTFDASLHPDNFHNCHLGLLLGRAAILKDRIIDTHMEPHGITAAQFKVLIIMAQFGVDTPAELCRNLSLDSGSMTRMLDRLEQKTCSAASAPSWIVARCSWY